MLGLQRRRDQHMIPKTQPPKLPHADELNIQSTLSFFNVENPRQVRTSLHGKYCRRSMHVPKRHYNSSPLGANITYRTNPTLPSPQQQQQKIQERAVPWSPLRGWVISSNYPALPQSLTRLTSQGQQYSYLICTSGVPQSKRRLTSSDYADTIILPRWMNPLI
jgi:hypothetical protein